VEKFAPLLEDLEKILGKELGQPVKINYRIYRSYTNGHEGLLSGEVDFMRVGPASYVSMKERNPEISLLVAQLNLVRCVIFTRTNSPINSLRELKGKAFAFGDAESTFGTHMAKAALLSVGIHADDLGTNSRHFRSHDEVFKAVMDSDEYAAGAANVTALDSNIKVLYDFPDVHVRMPFVARSGIDPDVAQALKAAFLAQRSPSVLTNLAPKGFGKASDQEYDGLRLKMKQSGEFGELAD